MAIRPIIIGEDPILRTSCEAVTEFSEETQLLIQDLFETVRDAGGVGLSAPQVGVALQVCVVCLYGQEICLVNPVITESDGKVYGMETCLSFPDTAFEVPRPERMTVHCLDANGESTILPAEGLMARVIAHEIDHLHGKLLFDYLDEEDFLVQMMQQLQGEISCSDDDVPSEDSTTGDGPAVDPQGTGALEDRNQDVVLALDIMADASWKLELALALLQDHLMDAPIDEGSLVDFRALVDQVQITVEQWDEKLSVCRNFGEEDASE